MNLESIIAERCNLGTKQLAVLVDPDNCSNHDELLDTLNKVNQSGADYLFIGGSLLTEDLFHETVNMASEISNVPVIIFPGSSSQVNGKADGILFLSLVSGRNPEFLIGNQVAAAPIIRRVGLETLSTAYLLIDGGKVTTAQYVSNTLPIPSDKPEITATTALAAKMMGLRHVYLDTGSGAIRSVSPDMVEKVKKATGLPLIVGGGIRSGKTANQLWNAGADIVVVGTAIERDPGMLSELSAAKSSA